MDGAVLTRRCTTVKVYVGCTRATEQAAQQIMYALLDRADGGWGQVVTQLDYLVPSAFRVPDSPKLTIKPRLLIIPALADGTIEMAEWQHFLDRFPDLTVLFFVHPAAPRWPLLRENTFVCQRMEELIDDLSNLLNDPQKLESPSVS